MHALQEMLQARKPKAFPIRTGDTPVISLVQNYKQN